MKAAADDFTAATDRLQREAGATPEQLDQLKQAVREMGASSGMGTEAAGNAVTRVFIAARHKREQHAIYAQLHPDVAALGNDAPHISICDGPSPGDLAWSWWAKGQRHWRSS